MVMYLKMLLNDILINFFQIMLIVYLKIPLMVYTKQMDIVNSWNHMNTFKDGAYLAIF